MYPEFFPYEISQAWSTLSFISTHISTCISTLKKKEKTNKQNLKKKRENKTIFNLQTLKTIIKINDYS